jgi:LuxR family maltose regulon positive regulatory protein
MAEPPSSTRPRVGADGWDGVLATKLHPPRVQPGFVARPRLLDRLDEALAGQLVLVCAPAGFGKTALLGDWARAGRRPVAWLSLDQGDNDPARFWRHLVAALDRIHPGIAEQLAPLLGPPAPPSFEGLVTALINQLATQHGDDEALLVLDDYHLLQAHQVHAALEFLLEHPPQGLLLVVASRADPPLALARLRARGQLVELRAGDLRFTAEEAAALLREAVGPDLPLPQESVAALAARTEGWVAGLQLAGLSLQGHKDVAGFVASFSGSHRYVLDFLAEEVLDRQPAEVRDFLLETSVLERLSGELGDAVTGRSDSQAMLERVERANLFLVPLDEVRGWWRYHHLFADLLRVRLHQQRPERMVELHRAAATWSEEYGLADDAIHHALAAEDGAWAARLVERHADAMLLSGERATVQLWLLALPDELVRSRPRLCLAQTWMALDSSDVAGAERSLHAAELACVAATDEPFEPSAGRAGSMLANVPATIALARAFLASLLGDAEATAGFASRALAEIGEGEWVLELVTRWHVAVAEWLRGRLPEAERGFAAILAGWRAAGEPGLAASGCHFLGRLQRAQGRLDEALGTYQEALEVGAAPGQPVPPAAGVGYVGMAEIAYQRGELDAALEHLTEGIPRCRQFNYTQPLATGLAALAWVRQAKQDAAGAMEAMEEARQVAPSPEVASLLNPVPAQRARLLLAQGDLAAAARWTRQRGLRPDDQPSYPREPEYLVLARVLLAQDLPGQALGLLEWLLASAAAQGRIGSLVEIQALSALALAAGGDQAGAMAALADTLTLAAPQGYVRVFADEGQPMRALLGRLVAAKRAEQPVAGSVPLGYLGRLLRAFERGAAPVVPGLIEPLSPRELEVLRLLAAGRPNQQIAEELVVAPNTVKKHVTHILEKLGATNRTEATARARELGLLL